MVAPSQGRELKQDLADAGRSGNAVAPSQGRELKLRHKRLTTTERYVAPSQGRELKPSGRAAEDLARGSPLHRGVN